MHDSHGAACPACGGALTPTPLGPQCAACLFAKVAEDVPEAPQGARAFGEYELLEELGRGGMGVVYRAWQPALQRSVALKMLLAGPFASPEFAERFRREAQAAARLRHPGLAAIYDAGECDGQAFYTMELIEGRTLAEVVRDKLPAPREAAALLEKTARAVAHAHAQGVLHRDLKPSNILLGADGEPKVADFGLARVMEGAGADAGLTLSTTVLGSPPYMAPEQAAGQPSSEATDVYALGAVFYELITGRPPHQGSSPQEILTHVREAAVVEPRRLVPSLPRDLETVCLKCLEREPARRYAGAAALADDLSRWLRGEPVVARPVSSLEKVWRWCVRRPALAAMLALTVAALVTLAAVSTVASRRMKRAADSEQAAGQQARERLYDSLVAQARASLLTNEGGRRYRALELLKQAREIRDAREIHELGGSALALTDLRRTLLWQAPDRSITWQAADGESWSALTRQDHTCSITIHRGPEGEIVARMDGLPAAAEDSRAVLSLDGALAAYPGADGQQRIVRISDGRILLARKAAAFGSFHPSGKSALFFSEEQRLEHVSLENGQPVAGWVPPRGVLSRNASQPQHAQFSPDGTRIACAEGDGVLLLLHAATGEVSGRIVMPSPLSCVSWHPAGDRLAAVCVEHVLVVAAETAAVEHSWSTRDTGQVLAAAFSPDGAVLATSGWDAMVRLHDWQRESLIVAARGGGNGCAWNAAGTGLVFSSDASITRWDVAHGAGMRLVSYDRTTTGGLPLQHFAFDASGRWLAVARRPWIEWFTADGSRLLAALPCGEVTAVAFHPVEPQLIAATPEGIMGISWRMEGTQLVLGPVTPLWTGGGASYFALNPAGTRAAVWSPSKSDPGFYRLRMFDTGSVWTYASGSADTYTLGRGPRWSPDGKWVADHCWHGPTVTVWSGATGAQYFGSGETGSWAGAHWAPDGQLWTATGLDERVWRMGQKDPVSIRPLSVAWENHVHAAAISPQGVLAAAPIGTGRIQLRQWPDPAPMVEWQHSRGPHIGSLRFSADGGRLGIVTADWRLSVWDFAATRAALEREGLRWPGPDTAPPPPAVIPDKIKVETRDLLPAARRAAAALLIPRRDAATPPRCLDISSAFNCALNFKWRNDGVSRDFAALRPGLQHFHGVPFDVRGCILLSGSGLLLRNPDIPPAARGLLRAPVKAARLHLLLGSAIDTDAGIVIGHVEMRQAGGWHRRIPLTSGQAINGSFLRGNLRPVLDGSTRIAWESPPAPEGDRVILYQHTWVNPRPEAAIESLDFTTTMEPGGPMLFALTVEEQ